MVIFFHFGGAKTAFLNGWLGVHLFFVLSGFLITTLLLREEEMNRRVSLANFWIRRIFRIAPAYYVVLLATLLLVIMTGQWATSGGSTALPFYLTFNAELVPPAMDYGHVWTIGIEQKFYLVWPLAGFVLGALASRRTAVRIALLCAVFAMTLVVPVLVHYSVISLGCLLAILLNSERGFRVLRILVTRAGAIVALALLVTMQLSAGALSDWAGSQVPVVLVYGLCATLSVPGLCATTATTRMLSAGPLRWLGNRSYSLYLTQILAGVVVAATFGMPGFGYIRTVLVAVTAALMADLSYRWVEQPAVALAKKITTFRAHRKVADRTVVQIA